MDPMKMALKKHIGKSKGHPAEGSMMEEKSESKKEEQKEDGDQAPELAGHVDAHPMGQHPMGEHHPLMSDQLGPEHIPLLQALIDHISHPGRDAMTMHERSGGALKEKMASIMGHKKAI